MNAILSKTSANKKKIFKAISIPKKSYIFYVAKQLIYFYYNANKKSN